MTVRISGRLGLKGSSGLNFRNVNLLTPSDLFAKGEQGVWYDPSDFSTMFQDAAGTTPVTEVEQPVGRILDKSGRGNHASQSTLGNRPVLSARYNLLTKTEDFGDAAWTKGFTTVSANTNETLDPIGVNTADKLVETAVVSDHTIYQILSNQITSTVSVYAKAAERTAFSIRFYASSGQAVTVTFDLSLGVVSQTSNQGTTYSNISSTVTNIGNGWYRCNVTATRSSGQTYYAFDINNSTTPTLNASGGNPYPGDITKGIYIWGADVRVSNDGVGLPVYQRVNTSTDYDTVGFPPYLRFDGSDDWMVTGTINPGAVDKAQVFAGVRRFGDIFGVIVESSSSINTSNGAILLGTTSLGRYAFGSKGTVYKEALQSGYSSPITNTTTGIGDIAGDVVRLRVNGIQASEVLTDQGTGNFLSYPLYIGRRGGTTASFNGRLYSLIVRFSSTNLSAVEIDATEKWVNSKTKAY